MSSAVGASTDGQLSGRTRLQERLAARYHRALEQFQESIRDMNEQANMRQLERLECLKADLARSHNEVEDVLSVELNRIERHQEWLDAYAITMGGWTPGQVVEPFLDDFHTAADSQHEAQGSFTLSTRRMEAERGRLLDVAVGIRRAYGSRNASIDASGDAIEKEERQRRTTVQASLRDLMLELARISYCGVTTSHVLAQRVIHSVNEKLAENYLGARSLLCQLKARELCKQRQYTNRVASMYNATLRRMAESQHCWARAILQSALFRRPAARLAIVEDITGVSAESRRRSTQFLENLGTVVCSLRQSRDVPEEPAGTVQQLGGSVASGWLRQYSERVTEPVFPESPEEVINEWRMKANVVVRNSLASCTAIMDRTEASEKARVEAAESVRRGLMSVTEWIYTPLESEPDLFLEASLVAEEDMDEPFKAFISKNIALITMYHAKGAQSLTPVLEQVRIECDWFSTEVRTGLAASHAFLERSLLTAFQSVLRLFGQTMEELVVTATNVLQFIRQFYRRQYEARKDHEDSLAVLEEAYVRVGDQLTHAGSVAAGEALFAQGLAYLDRIAECYTSYHHSVVTETEQIKDAAASHAAEQCKQLQMKLGVESQEETMARLERDRAKRYREALLQVEQEAAAEKTKRKTGAGGRKRSSSMNDSRSSSRIASFSLSEFPLEEVHYEQITAADGTVFNLVGPMRILGDVADNDAAVSGAGSALGAAFADTTGRAAMTTPSVSTGTAPSSSTKGSAKRNVAATPAATASSTTKRGRHRASSAHSQVDLTTENSAVVEVTEPPAELRDCYQAMWRDTIALTENFLRQEDITAWQALLRVELVNWLVRLQRSSGEELATYVSTTKAAIDKETNNLLRHHRRRPAVFQAELYEARVRELDNDINASDKYCARLLERVNKVEGVWLSLKTNPDWLSEDGELLRQLQVLQDKALEAPSTSVLQVQERRHASLCAQYLEAFEQRSRTVSDSVERQQETLELECQHYLADRAKQLAEDTFTGEANHEAVLAQDGVSQRIRDILSQLHTTVEAVRAYVAKEQEQRQATVNELRERYESTFAQNNAELRLLASLQETYGRLKAQVQSAVMLSAAAETKLNGAVELLEKELSKPVVKPSLASTMKILVQHDYSLDTSKRPVVEELTPDAVPQLYGEAERQSAVANNTIQRQIRSSELSEVLSLLDSLRAMLYLRGTALNAVLYSVVLYRILPDNYVEPKQLPKEAEAQLAAAVAKTGKRGKGRGAGGAGGAGGANGASGATPTTASSVPPQDPLPVIATIEGQLKEWTAEVKGDTLKAMQAHFGQYPPPLHRRLPTMRGGYPEDVNQLTDSVCTVQENRLREHIADAVRTFYQQVQRVYLAVQVMPSYLSASLYGLTASALETRVAALFECFGDLYSYSSALKTVHKTSVKVSLSNQSQRAKRMQLAEAEKTRQAVTDTILHRVWGLVLRELQDEAGLHAARCVNTVNTFFYLLRGLTLPEHLLPSDGGEFAVGRHRGLRQLIKLRDKENRIREQEQSSAHHKDRHLQETLPLLKQSKTAARDSASARASTDATPAGGPLPQPSTQDVDFTGLPLTGFQPLVPYNEEHPDDPVDPPLSARAYYLINADAASLSGHGGPAGGGGASNAAGGVSGGKNKGKKANAATPLDGVAAGDAALGLSPSFIAPRTQVHQETVVLARECVELLNSAAREVADDVDKSFRGWTERERQWQESWMLMIQTLDDASDSATA